MTFLISNFAYDSVGQSSISLEHNLSKPNVRFVIILFNSIMAFQDLSQCFSVCVMFNSLLHYRFKVALRW